MLQWIPAGILRDHVLVGRAEKLPFRDGSFDLVSAVTVVQHIPTPDQDKALEEMARVVKTGGHVILFELIRGRAPHIFPRNPEDWIARLSSSGLSLVYWFGQEYLLLDRSFVRSVEIARIVMGRSPVASVPSSSYEGGIPSQQPAIAVKGLYWLARRITFTLSFWMEPVAQLVCASEWANHGVFVFKKQ